METLEVEIGYIQQLMDDEVSRVLQQFYCWDMLEDWVIPPFLMGSACRTTRRFSVS